MEPPETAELYNKLYKTEEEQQIFLVYSILESPNESKIFLDFLIANQR